MSVEFGVQSARPLATVSVDPPPGRTSRKAIWALVLALASFVIWPVAVLGAVPALLLANSAREDMNRSCDLGGRGVAKAAIWTAVGALVLMVVYYVVVFALMVSWATSA